MVAPYPKMHDVKQFPAHSEEDDPLWRTFVQQVATFEQIRVLAIHCHSLWVGQYALAHGADLFLAVDHDAEKISVARQQTRSDRLRYRILPDHWLKLLTGPFDVILGTFENENELVGIAPLLSDLLTPKGQVIGSIDLAQPINRLELDPVLRVTKTRQLPSTSVQTFIARQRKRS